MCMCLCEMHAWKYNKHIEYNYSKQSHCYSLIVQSPLTLLTGVCYIREFKIFTCVLVFHRHISLPDSHEKPTLDNIDSYMLKLQSLMMNGTQEHQQLIKEIKAIMKQLQNSLANGVTPVVAVKSNNTLLSTSN